MPVALTGSFLAHALFVILSTRIYLQSQDQLGRQAARLFRVEVTRTITPQRRVAPPPAPEPVDVESIEQILQQETVLEPPTLPRATDSTNRIDERTREKAQAEYIPREKAASVSPESDETVDLKVVALAQESFAEGLGPRRREVSPGGGIIVPSDVMPTWSSAGDTAAGVRGGAGMRIASQQAESATEKAESVAKERAQEESELARLHGKLAAGDRLLAELALPAGVVPALEQRELVQKYESLDDLLDIQLYTYRPAGSDGYFMVRISARADAQLSVLPKDIIFVIDSSKSIGQAKLNEARSAVRKCLRLLNPYDRFNVVAFSREPLFFAANLVEASPANTDAAEQFLHNLAAGGQTDVYAALRPLVDRQTIRTVPYIILLFSDGKSTVGDLDSREIINQVTELNRSRARASIYAFGGGSSVNRYLLDLLASRNKGVSEITRVVSRIDSEMPVFYGRLRDPILTGLSANYAGLDPQQIYPRRLPDFYRGSDITVLGRFDAERDFSMRLTGEVTGKRKELVFRRRFADALPADEDVALQWATRKAYYIIERICEQGPVPELVSQLEALKTQYGVHTAYDERGREQ